MADRKVFNKYIPPDYDPSKVPKLKRGRPKQIVIRIMAPMNMRCMHCGEYIYVGTKFNSRMEVAEGEGYLGLRVYRFYMRCRRCHGEFIIKTDPKNAEYVCEGGCYRIHDYYGEAKRSHKAEEERRELVEEGDAMKALERRTFDSQKELESMEQLDSIRALKAQQSKISTEDLLNAIRDNSAADGEREKEGEREIGEGEKEEDFVDELEEYRKAKRRIMMARTENAEAEKSGESDENTESEENSSDEERTRTSKVLIDFDAPPPTTQSSSNNRAINPLLSRLAAVPSTTSGNNKTEEINTSKDIGSEGVGDDALNLLGGYGSSGSD